MLVHMVCTQKIKKKLKIKLLILGLVKINDREW